jgi:DNA repair exonuclease SbcCD ATPase subunit
MKVLKVILENWIGISKPKVEIDFTKNISEEHIKPNKIVMLIGGNGSGKTTLLSTLHPFAETNDARSNPIIPGKNGYKEIHIQDNENIYVIKHHYKKATKSFISKNGEELNENGGVRTFEEIVYKELGVDKDFFKIGRIGSNVTNFINLTTSERKKYLSKLLPDVDDYLEAFKIVSEKFKELKKEINYLSQEIGNDSIEEFEKLKNSLNENINFREESLINLNSNLISKKEKLPTDLDVRNELKIKSKNLKNAEDRKNTFEEEYPQLNKGINWLNETKQKSILKLNSLETELINLESNKIKIKEEIVNNENELKRKKDLLEKIEEGNSLEDLEELKKEKEKSILQIEEEIKSLKKYKSFNISLNDLLSIKSSMFNLKEGLINIKSQYSDESIEWLESFNIGIEAFNSLKILIKENKENIENIKREIQDLKNEITKAQSNLSKLDILSKRPEDCIIDSCAFIKDALKYKGLDEVIIELEKKLEEYKSNLKELEKELEKNEEKYELYKLFEKLYKDNVNTDAIKILVSELNSFDKFRSLITKKISEIESIFQTNKLQEYLQLKEILEKEKLNLNNIQEKIKILKKQKSYIDELKKNISDLKNKINDLNNNLEEKENEIEDINKNIKISKQKIKILTEYFELLEEYNNLKNEVNTLEQYIEIINEIEDIVNEIEKLKNEIKPLKEQLDKIKIKIAKLKEFTERKENTEKQYKIVELVKNALDPTKGIPLHFIGGFLNGIQTSVNELLDIAYKGRFQMEFELNDKDFIINLIGDGIPRDINDASQGETAFATVSLSLSMIEQRLGRYNLIYLDEIDGPLDPKNRVNFIEILNKQIEKLGLEQVFIISHNNEFDAYPLDLIVMPNANVQLKDPSFMSNKNLLYI